MNTNIITKKRWAVAILAVVLVAILSVTLVACGTKDLSETSSGEITAEQAPVYDFTAEIQNTEFIKLAMSGTRRTAVSVKRLPLPSLPQQPPTNLLTGLSHGAMQAT